MFFGYLFIISGVLTFVFYLYLNDAFSFLSSSKYALTQGVVEAASLSEIYDPKGIVIYETKVKYTYVVNKQEYHNNTLYKNSNVYGDCDKYGMELYLKKNNLIQGSSVNVHYQKANPSKSYILETPPGTTILFVISVGFILIGFGLLFFA